MNLCYHSYLTILSHLISNQSLGEEELCSKDQEKVTQSAVDEGNDLEEGEMNLTHFIRAGHV